MRKTISQEQQTIFQQLAQIAGSENVITDSQATLAYGVDGLVPAAVVFPTTTEQVSQIVKLGNQSRLSIIPWGSGSRQQVGPCLSAADIVLCLKHMNHIVEVDASNFSVQVEAGLANSEMQRQLKKDGLFFPLDPLFMETSTIGGELASNASGPLRASYGTVRDLALGTVAVTPTGDIIRTGGKTMKNVAGIDLCKLLVGSWGTLGIITEAVLRLYPLPEASESLFLTFAGIEDASRLINRLLNSPLYPTSVELMDGIAGRHLVQAHVPPLKETEVLLMIEIRESAETVKRHLKEVRAMAEANGARSTVNSEGEEANRTWNAYRGLHQAILNRTPSAFQGKASVPISQLGNMFKTIKEVGNKYSLETGIRAHGYNGILYNYFAAENDDAVKIAGDLRQAAAALGGYFMIESAPLGLRKTAGAPPHRNDYNLMKRIKTAFDPNNILNPGRLLGEMR